MGSQEKPTSYAELAEVVAMLPHLIRENRRRKRLSLRGAAEEIGTTFNTVTRIEKGDDFNSRILPDIIRWLGRP